MKWFICCGSNSMGTDRNLISITHIEPPPAPRDHPLMTNKDHSSLSNPLIQLSSNIPPQSKHNSPMNSSTPYHPDPSNSKASTI